MLHARQRIAIVICVDVKILGCARAAPSADPRRRTVQTAVARSAQALKPQSMRAHDGRESLLLLYGTWYGDTTHSVRFGVF